MLVQGVEWSAGSGNRGGEDESWQTQAQVEMMGQGGSADGLEVRVLEPLLVYLLRIIDSSFSCVCVTDMPLTNDGTADGGGTACTCYAAGIVYVANKRHRKILVFSSSAVKYALMVSGVLLL